jgi:fructokinase
MLAPVIRAHVFGGEWDGRIVPARWGDSSGVRGAAWLWPFETQAG